MRNSSKYPGIDEDPSGAMTPTGNIIRDAWVFGIIPETETCAGWTQQAINDLYDKVTEAWAPYGHLPSRLPQPLRERHQHIYDVAVQKARKQGWAPDLEDDD